MEKEKKKDERYTKLKLYTSIVCYAFSIALYIFDVLSDILLGKMLVHDEGKIILGLIFLPVVAQFSLVLFHRIFNGSNKKKKNDKLTLLGIDWLNLDDNNPYTTIVTIILIIMRIHIIRVYILLIKSTFRKNKKLKKKLDTRMRAEMFMETCFESLPQCCIQLYLFGKYSTISHLQVVSFTMSTLTLVYSFTLAHIEREVEIYHHSSKRSKLGIRIEACEEDEDEEGDEEEESLTKQNRRLGSIKLAKISKRGIHLKLLDLGSPPPKKLNLNLDLQYHKDTCSYDVSDALIRSKQLSVRIERNFFFWMRAINISIESPVFFLTAFPTISLFSCLFGHRFLLFYIPVAIHFVAEYWWWRPYVYKLGMTGSFHTIFLAFKLLERIMILGMICIWFIKVMNYSKPLTPIHPDHLPSLVWPHPNKFLATVATYEKDGIKQDWAKDCKSIANVTYDYSKLKLKGAFNKFTSPQICAINAATYITCVVFYMNVIGMIWEVLNYIIFWSFKWYTKYEVWKESQYIMDEIVAAQSYCATIMETCCSNKYQVASDLEDY